MSFQTHTAADALRKGVGAALLADQGVVAALGGSAVFDAVPDRQRPPYVVIGRTVAADWSTASEGGEAVTLFLHVWTQAERRDGNQAVQGAVRAALAGPVATPGHHLVSLRLELSETRRDPMTGHVHGVMRLRALIEPAA